MTKAAFISMGLIAGGLAGCGAADRAAPAGPSRDFALAVTVYAPPTTDNVPAPADRRPARYVLEPDGSLRVALGPGVGPSVYPSLTRVLRAAERESIWADLRRTGWLDGEPGARVGSPLTFRPEPSRTVYLTSFVADGRRRSAAAGPDDPAVRGLVNRLAALSWLP